MVNCAVASGADEGGVVDDNVGRFAETRDGVAGRLGYRRWRGGREPRSELEGGEEQEK